MRKWLVGVLVAVLAFGGVAYAADVAAPTLADVYKVLLEIKADVAAIKAAGGATSTNQAGTLATATSADGKVTLTVTSVMAGPDATVVGISVNNQSASPVMMSNLTGTSLTAGGVKLELSPWSGISGEVLPGTTAKGVLLAGPAPAGSTDVTLRVKIFDTKTYDDVLETALTLKLK